MGSPGKAAGRGRGGTITPAATEDAQVFVTRRETLSAAHRLHCVHLSDEENRELYGPCNNIHGHGHNYVIEVTVVGEPDAGTGMVMNISDLKRIMKTQIMDALDHKNIDKQVDYFSKSGLVSTTENVAIFCWESIQASIPSPATLYSVKIWETDKNIVTYYGK